VRDADVRSALHALLRVEHEHEWSQTRILNELSLCGEVRVDVAVLNGQFAGYELKSARDTLERLPTQVTVYSRVLDHATLVVAERHRVAALAMIPAWWGIVAAVGEDGVRLERVRLPVVNPSVDPASVVRLLWRDELLGELIRLGRGDGLRSKSRTVLSAALTSMVPADVLSGVVRERLKQRGAWRVDPSRQRGGAALRGAATP